MNKKKMWNDISKYLTQYQDIYGSEFFVDDTQLNINRYYDRINNKSHCYISKNHKNTIFEEGNENASIVIIGESITSQEDSHQLLKKILLAINLKFSDIYLINIVRDDSELSFSKDIECKEYILKKINSVNPNLVISLGSIPVFIDLDKTDHIDTLRNKIYKYQNFDLIFTYHPQDLLKNKSLKLDAWNDFRLIKKNYIDGK